MWVVPSNICQYHPRPDKGSHLSECYLDLQTCDIPKVNVHWVRIPDLASRTGMYRCSGDTISGNLQSSVEIDSEKAYSAVSFEY